MKFFTSDPRLHIQIIDVFVKMLLIMIMIILSRLASSAQPKSYNDIGNPMINSEKCGRKGIKSYVCDPDGLITVEQAFQLDEIINMIFNLSTCPCALLICRGVEGRVGYRVGVAMIEKMVLTQTTQYRSDTDPEYSASIMNRARLFASKILNKWKMGKCGEDTIIFYSMLDNVLYVATGSKFRLLLPDSLLGDILRKAVFTIESKTKDSITEALKFILQSIKELLGGKGLLPSSHSQSSIYVDDEEN